MVKNMKTIKNNLERFMKEEQTENNNDKNF